MNEEKCSQKKIKWKTRGGKIYKCVLSLLLNEYIYIYILTKGFVLFFVLFFLSKWRWIDNAYEKSKFFGLVIDSLYTNQG